MEAVVKKEPIEPVEVPVKEKSSSEASKPSTVIDLSSSDSDLDNSDDSDDSDDDAAASAGKKFEGSGGINGNANKKRKLDDLGIVLPPGFLDPLPPEESLPLAAPVLQSRSLAMVNGCKQFWKAGDFDDGPAYDSLSSSSVGMAHLRVHPKFLHSNATSHKWALGAIAELLDNSLDEVCNGATFVNIDTMSNIKDGSRMLVIEDNGGGMDPDKMRQCMSLGYSVKSKLANTIGQYGNGFKTSTMRLGADVIVFSRCRGNDGKSPTQSIGMLSYTFLRRTKKEDIVVPMLDFEKVGAHWNKLMQSSPGDWNSNLETIVHWSPYSNEADLLNEFNLMNDQGTRIIIFNLWEDDEGELELDFDTDEHDIELRGVNRDEKKIEMAKQFPNSKHFLTYQHSLRSYASILYLRLPRGFRMVLRGKDVEHHNIVNDLMLTQEVTYKPKQEGDGVPRDSNMVAAVTIGFVKDAKHHIDVQGFNVYHKNRLIKPFWRLWNAAGSDGRGVIGVLEANFVEPAHDKQGFERTTVLSRLEARLVQMQKTYWSTYCHKIGYAPRRQKKQLESAGKESSPEYFPKKSSQHSRNKPIYPRDKDGYHTFSNQKQIGKKDYMGKNGMMNSSTHRGKSSSLEPASSFAEEDSDYDMQNINQSSIPNGSTGTASPAQRSCERENQHTSQSFSQNSDNSEIGVGHASNGRVDRSTIHSQKKAANVISSQNGNAISGFSSVELDQLKIENFELRKRLKNIEESSSHNLEFESPHSLLNGDDTDSEKLNLSQLKTENLELKTSLKKMELSVQNEQQFERDRCRSLEAQLKESEEKIAELNKEQEALIDIFSEERNRRDIEEENLRKKLKDASNTIQQLLDRIRALEKMKSP